MSDANGFDRELLEAADEFDQQLDELLEAADEVLANLREGGRDTDEETGEEYADIKRLADAVEVLR